MHPAPGAFTWPAAMIVWGPGFVSSAHRHHCVQLVMTMQGTLRVRAGAASMLLMSEPEASELMTVVVTFEDVHGGTRYTARVRHWTNTEREVEVE